MSEDFSRQLSALRERLVEAQARSRRLRSEAFVRYVPVVAGQRLCPITLDLYNRLVAFESPFAVGGPLSIEDLHVFVWLLSPEFSQFDAAARRARYRAVEVALRPRRPLLSSVARLLCPLYPRLRFLARFIEPTRDELILAAIAECSRLVAEAIGDFPGTASATDSTGAVEVALPFPLQAQVLNLMRRELGVPYEETRALPLKELAQLLREVAHTESKGRAPLLSRAESAVWLDYERLLDAQTAAGAPRS